MGQRAQVGTESWGVRACAGVPNCRKICSIFLNQCLGGDLVSRWKAFLIHFTLSLVIFAFLLAIILVVWYPGLLFEISGGWEGLRIVIGVDLVLGPLLTLIVYKVGKPSLKFDLSCIAIFQMVCLSGGVWVVYNERPVVLAVEYDAIFSLNAREFAAYGNTMSSLDSFSGPYPKVVYIELPVDNQEAGLLSLERQLNGEPLFGDTSNYLPLATDSIPARSRFRAEQRLRDGAGEEIQREIDESCRFIRFVSASERGFVCFDVATLSITKFFEE